MQGAKRNEVKHGIYTKFVSGNKGDLISICFLNIVLFSISRIFLHSMLIRFFFAIIFFVVVFAS